MNWPFKHALEDHALEGTSLMLAEPSHLIRTINYLIAATLIGVIVWSFFARADVIVSAPGTLAPETDIRRVYAPIDGELVDSYASVGVPVREGDIVARINARGAIEAASKVVSARSQLAQAKLAYDGFPGKRALMEQKIASLEAKQAFQQKEHDERLANGLHRLAEAQRARLVEARSNLEQAERRADTAEVEAQQYERLYDLPGGGGVSQTQVMQKRNAYLDALAQKRNVQARLSTLEYELSTALAQADQKLANTVQSIAETRIQIEQTRTQIDQEQAQIEVRYRTAQLSAQSAERVSFKHFDENNFLKIYAPVSGVVTEVSYTQQGDKIMASRPLLSIAPEGSRKVLKISIPEKDRGFLAVGQTAKLKFNAFPYQTYGSIPGRLDAVSPTVVKQQGQNAASYRGTVQLDIDFVETANGPASLRYGMSAVAEIVVRERRVIDFALDPLRRFR